MNKIFIVLGLLGLQMVASAVVIGELSRMPVSNTTSPTFRVYGQVENFCSGTMISPRLVLTAAHCVWDQDNRVALPVRTFTPGRTPTTAPFGSIAVKNIHVPQSYLNGDDRQDLAVLVLENAIGLQTGWLDIGWDLTGFSPHNSALGGFKANGTIVGYPGDQEAGSMWNAACEFYVPSQRPYLPQYRCDTFGGMSGSAIVVAGPHNKSYIVGVHTKGHNGFNSGILLTHENKVFLEAVMKNYEL